jgi:hypothetical protein
MYTMKPSSPIDEQERVPETQIETTPRARQIKPPIDSGEGGTHSQVPRGRFSRSPSPAPRLWPALMGHGALHGPAAEPESERRNVHVHARNSEPLACRNGLPPPPQTVRTHARTHTVAPTRYTSQHTNSSAGHLERMATLTTGCCTFPGWALRGARGRTASPRRAACFLGCVGGGGWAAAAAAAAHHLGASTQPTASSAQHYPRLR